MTTIRPGDSYTLFVLNQGLSQRLETGCQKFAIVKFLGFQILKGAHNILRFQPFTSTCIKFIRMRHAILIQCYGNYIEMKKNSIICLRFTL